MSTTKEQIIISVTETQNDIVLVSDKFNTPDKRLTNLKPKRPVNSPSKFKTYVINFD